MRKSQSPKLSPSQFEPELVWTMRSVLDSAVDQIDVVNRTPATKAKMAERILRAASDGITDPVTLTAIAIEDVCSQPTKRVLALTTAREAVPPNLRQRFLKGSSVPFDLCNFPALWPFFFASTMSRKRPPTKAAYCLPPSLQIQFARPTL